MQCLKNNEKFEETGPLHACPGKRRKPVSIEVIGDIAVIMIENRVSKLMGNTSVLHISAILD